MTGVVSLSELYQLRVRLANCGVDEDAEFGECAERLATILGANNTLLTVDDNAQRRSLLASLWRFVTLDWHRNQFRRLGHTLIPTISAAIFGAAQQIEFTNDRIWFGGVCRCQTATLAGCSNTTVQEDRTPLRQNACLYFALGLMLAAYQKDIAECVPVNELEQFMRRMQDMYVCSTALFLHALLEHDERLLQTMAAMHRIDAEKRLPTSTMDWCQPDTLFLHLLRKIQLDPLVFVDWCQSEPEPCFVMLKAYSHRLAQLPGERLAQLAANSNQKSADINERHYDIVHGSTVDEAEPGKQHNHMVFEVEEIHGEQRVQRRVTIPTQATNTIHLRYPTDEGDTVMTSEGLVHFCAELRDKLQRLGPGLNFPAKIICQNLGKIVQNLNDGDVAQCQQ